MPNPEVTVILPNLARITLDLLHKSLKAAGHCWEIVGLQLTTQEVYLVATFLYNS